MYTALGEIGFRRTDTILWKRVLGSAGWRRASSTVIAVSAFTTPQELQGRTGVRLREQFVHKAVDPHLILQIPWKAPPGSLPTEILHLHQLELRRKSHQPMSPRRHKRKTHVSTLLRQQFSMRPLLRDPSFGKAIDNIRLLDRR